MSELTKTPHVYDLPPDAKIPTIVEPVAVTVPREADEAEEDRPLGRLSETFWSRTPRLREIRELARTHRNAPEALLNVLMSRAAGHLRPTVRVSTGVGSPATLNWYCGLYGASGKGKGRTEQTSAAALPFDKSMHDFIDIMISTGQGITASFGETVTEDAADKDIVTVTSENRGEAWEDKGGKAQKVKVFRQKFVRGYILETEGTLLKEMAAAKSGGVINPTLCKGWTSEAQGQSNATEGLSRRLDAGSYTLSKSISVQPEPAAALLAMGNIGLPQRLAWTFTQREDAELGDLEAPDDVEDSAYDEYDDEEVEAAQVTIEPLRVRPGASMPLNAWLAGLTDVKVVIPRGAKEEIRRLVDRAESEKSDVNPLETHEPLWRAKAAALFALIHGETRVTRDHWEMARDLWAMSCGVRQMVEALAQRQLSEAAAAKRDEAVRTGVETALGAAEAVHTLAEGAHPAVIRTAGKLARSLVKNGATRPTSALKKSTSSHVDRETWRARSEDKSLFETAVEYAEGEGWVAVTASGLLQPGLTDPPAAGRGY